MNKNRKFNLIDRKELKNQSKTIRRIEDNKPVEVIKSKRTTYVNKIKKCFKTRLCTRSNW